jgi:hypothetical protein
VQGSVVQAGSIQHLSLIAPGVPAMPVVPRQLPLAVLDFTGRAEQLAYLDGLLDHEPYPPGDAGAPPTVPTTRTTRSFASRPVVV